MVRSNDHVGVVTPSRMELWRDDLVRTVEFGDVDNPAEPGLQPFTGCTIRSALTRSNMLGVVENCPHDKKSGNHAMLRLMKAVPQDSRKPEIIQSYNLGSETAHIVAIGEDKAAVYVDATTPRIDVVDTKGHVTSSRDVTPSPLINEDAHVNTASEHHVFEPAVSDGPHHMFWWDGARLYAFDPESLSVDFVVADSLGTGDVIGDHHLLAPTNGAVSVIDTRTGRVEKTMPVDRQGGSPAPVGLRIAGTTVVERRGDALIGYRAEQAP